MIEKVNTYKSLILIFIFWLLVEYFAGIFPRYFTGWIISIHSIMMCVAAFLIIVQKKEVKARQWFALGYLTVGLSDFLWGFNYFFTYKTSRSWEGILISGIITASFLMFSQALFMSSGRSLNSLKNTVPIAILVSIIMMAIVLSMPLMVASHGILKIFYSVEIISIIASFILMTISSMIMIGSRSLNWSVIGCSFFCFAVGDLSIRVDKVISDTLNFDIYSVLFSAGLYMSLLELWRNIKAETESIRDNKCLFVSFKSGFLLVTLSTILLFLLFQHKNIDAQRLVIFSSCLAAYSGIYVSKYFANIVASHSINLASFISQIDENKTNNELPLGFPYEVEDYYTKVIKAAISEKRLEADYKAKSALAHNISSPIEVQCSILEDRENLSLDDIKMIKHSAQNMRDMVNYARSWKSRTTETEIEDLPLNSVIKLIIAQKNIEFRTKPNIRFNFVDNTKDTLFTKFSETEAVSIFSNIINNSVESIGSSQGNITLELKRVLNHAIITISDNGPGIPSYNLRSIFNHGFSTKASGDGIGLHDAEKIVQKMGGKVSAESDGKSFTKIILKLLICEPPYWHTKFIDFFSQGRILVLDDNNDHHSLVGKIIDTIGLKAEHYRSYTEFEGAIRSLSVRDKILMDYQLNEDLNGIELITKHNLQNNAYLLTSYSDEQSIRLRCNKEKIKLIPKSSFSRVEFIVHKTDLFDVSQLVYADAVVLDDQDIVLKYLKQKSSKNKCKLETFNSVLDFYSNICQFERNTPIFIDQNLGYGLLGTDIAKVISECYGFTEIYLSSADADILSRPSCIKSVLSKKSLLNMEWINGDQSKGSH